MRGADADRFAAAIEAGGVVLFGADTVYGLACDPDDEAAIARLYALKRRPPAKAAAVMFFDRDAALAPVGPRTRALLERLLPGGLTALVPNAGRRFPLACGEDPGRLGIRVPDLPRLAGAPPVMQSSANLSGGPDPRRLEEVPDAIRAGADLVIDSGEVGGTASTVVDLTAFETEGRWRVVRPGAVPESAIAAAERP